VAFYDGTDALGRTVRLDERPQRIVSLVPSQTELLADLGLDDEVVGLTRFCVHPDGWKARKPIVGGTKNVDVERVRALRPDLVIANKEENVRAQIEALAEVYPVFVTDVADVAGAVRMVRDVGALVGRAAQAEAIAAETEAGFAALAADLAGAPLLRALYLIWRDPWMTAGGDTIISDVLTHGGFDNVAAEQARYPALRDDEVGALRPDVVLLSSEPYPFGEKHVAEVQALVPGARVVLVDGEPFSWYGSRLRHTPPYLRALRQRLANAAASA
jgi:ABC-type Fe3+-hydroxamate transport system substrate-binding protein